ncbi:Inner membrane localized protein [Melia azedarach]|uniref:Inner membrane localized protein n=1 Tax=Melia azedarach TaxID=155640 RepID=A0ACC1WTU0_MELAZ|nr:Inner membrane localized protein [Melia azedarach]
MTAVSNSLVLPKTPGSILKPLDQCLGSNSRVNLSFSPNHQWKVQLSSSKSPLTVKAAYSDDGRPNSAGIFVGGFVLGGIIVGTLGCVYAPQISKALAGAAADRKDLMRKLPKFIYDEEKALEKTRKILTEKIAQLNSAIDDVSAQLRTEDEGPNGVAVNSGEVEANI